jgi:hypothetical protein
VISCITMAAWTITKTAWIGFPLVGVGFRAVFFFVVGFFACWGANTFSTSVKWSISFSLGTRM